MLLKEIYQLFALVMMILIIINVVFIKDHATVSVETRAVTDQMLTTASTVSTSARAA